MVGFGYSPDCFFRPSAARILAVACANVGLCCSATCCSSSRLIVFWPGTEVWAMLGALIASRAVKTLSINRATKRDLDSLWSIWRFAVHLFMVMLHFGHVGHRFLALLSCSKLHDFLVFVGW